METHTVKTSLRPDYHQLSPFFGLTELRIRSRRLTFEDATLLLRPNIKRYCELYGMGPYFSYLRQPAEAKAEALSRRLCRVGIPRRIAEIVADISRSEVVPKSRRQQAFLDRSIHVSGSTYLSAPTLVAYMLDTFRLVVVPDRPLVVEIGSGTGFHLLAFGRACEDSRLVGLDTSADACVQTTKLLRAHLPNQLVAVENESALSSLWLNEADYVYSTAALSAATVERLQSSVRPGSSWTVPRQLLRDEFMSEPKTSWLRNRFGSYENYLEDEWWRFLALETAHIENAVKREILDVMYDLQFVRFTE